MTGARAGLTKKRKDLPPEEAELARLVEAHRVALEAVRETSAALAAYRKTPVYELRRRFEVMQANGTVRVV